MNLKEYNKSISDYYHFESSDCFCDRGNILKAESIVKERLDLDGNDLIQLKSIVSLELLRNQLAFDKVTVGEYKSKMQDIIKNCAAKADRDPFDNYRVHEIFYHQLNSLYNE